jgi:hypothetical protein
MEGGVFMISILGAGIGEVYTCPCDGRQLGLGKMRSWFLPTGFPSSRENAGNTGPIRNLKKGWLGKVSCS